jgi:hypothetical protein
MERIYTTPLLDKLGVKPGARVAVIRINDVVFLALLRERTTDITEGTPLPETELIFFAADSIDELLEIGSLQTSIVANGAIWVVSKKGKQATLRDVDVIDAAKSIGLVDNKVASFSDTHTALRLVIPIARRAI